MHRVHDLSGAYTNDLVDWLLLLNGPFVLVCLNPLMLSVSWVQCFVLLEPKVVEFCPPHFVWFFQEFYASLKYVFFERLILLLPLRIVLKG